jgi:hypothetical protein
MKSQAVYGLCLVGLLVGLSACLATQAPTPQDALKEFPGYLQSATMYVPDSVTILQEQAIDQGVVLLYRWQSPASARQELYCLAGSVVGKDLRGWRVESSAALDEIYREPLFGCAAPLNDGLIVGYGTGGSRTDLTFVFGVSAQGSQVRVHWADGQIDTVPLVDGSFLITRSTRTGVERVEALDASGALVSAHTWR